MRKDSKSDTGAAKTHRKPEKMNCPVCGSEKLSTTTLQVQVNTGAYFICEDCGEPVNKDGSRNQVLLNQLGDAVNDVMNEDEDDDFALVTGDPKPPLIDSNAKVLA